MPPIHPLIYITILKKPTTLPTPITKQKKKSSYKYIHTPYPMQNDQYLDQQLKDQSINVIMRKKQTKVDLAKYHHATCMSLTITTFTKAISNNNFIT